MSGRACFSRSGWWQTLCGLDAANQGFGWTTKPAKVGCEDCLAKIEAGEHRRWKRRHILMKMRRYNVGPTK
jgi:hypothetical protein